MILESGSNYPLAPQAFGEIAPQFWPAYFMPRMGMTLETAFASYGQLYRTQPWVYAGVRKVARSIARLGVAIWDQTPEKGQQKDLTGPYAQLMADPCPEMSPTQFWTWIASTIEIYGETFLLKTRDNPDNNRITGLIPMHPSMTQIFRAPDGEETYRFMGRPNVVFERGDVVPYREFNSDNVMRGLSRLEPLRSTLLNEDSARRSMESTWQKGTRPSGVVTSERELGTAGRDKLKAAFAAEHQGTANHGGVIVLEDGVTFAPIDANAVNMAYIQSRELNREEVCGVMDLPPSCLQIMEHATFSNITENMRSLYRDSLSGRIEFIENITNWEIGREFYGNKLMKFNVAEQLRGAFEQRAAAVAQLVNCGVYEPAEGRELFDLNVAGPEANQLLVQGAMVPLKGLQEAAEQAAQPPQPLALPAGQSQRATQSQPSETARKYVRDIKGYIGGGQSLQDVVITLLDKQPADASSIKEAVAHIIRGEF